MKAVRLGIAALLAGLVWACDAPPTGSGSYDEEAESRNEDHEERAGNEKDRHDWDEDMARDVNSREESDALAEDSLK